MTVETGKDKKDKLGALLSDPVVTPREAREILRCGETKYFELVRAGELEVRQLGRNRLVTTRSITALIDRLPRATYGSPRTGRGRA